MWVYFDPVGSNMRVQRYRSGRNAMTATSLSASVN